MKQNALKWLWNVTGKQKFYVAALMLAHSLHGGSGVLYALLLRNIVDSAAEGSRSGFRINVIRTVLLVLAQVLLRALIRGLEEQSRSSLENRFKSRLMRNILRKDFATVSAVHSGEWLNRMTNDCTVVANNFTEILPGIAGMTVKLISAAVMLVALQPRFAVILIPAGFLMILFTYAFRRTLKRLHKTIQEKDGKLRIFLQERLGSLMMIRSFAAEERTESEAAEFMQTHKSARMRRMRFSALCNIGFQTGMQGMYLLGVCYCGYGILTRSVTYGTLTAVTQLISQIQAPFANITGYLPKFYAMTASAERLMEIEQFADDCDTDAKSIAEIRAFYHDALKEIVMQDIGFTYLPAADNADHLTKAAMPVVLQGISLHIRKGEYVAFTGQSGCGKSTVLKLLMCIYKPDSGERCLTDLHGNTQNLDAAWHRLFAYVPQGNQLMRGTIREIVAFADQTQMTDEEKIANALKIACAEDFVGELEQGIDTLLGERGTGLSEGQMQRIAIARAIFSGSPVLLLDESTSALDEQTEQRLLRNLKQMTDKTVVIITHRQAALAICDRILEIRPDRITEKSR